MFITQDGKDWINLGQLYAITKVPAQEVGTSKHQIYFRLPGVPKIWYYSTEEEMNKAFDQIMETIPKKWIIE